MPVMHVSQLASALGLEWSEVAKTSRMAWDTVTILTDWLDCLNRADWRTLLAPTPSRGRPFQHLGPHTFHPIELLPVAWRTCDFDWRPQEDKSRVDPLTSKGAVVDYCSGILQSWQLFLLDHDADLDRRDPNVQTPRGSAPFSVVMGSQRNHAAYHHRQLVSFLPEHGVHIPDALDVTQMADIELPDELWD